VSFTQRHLGVNLAAAAAAAVALGVPAASLPAGAGSITLSRWRGESLPLPGGGVLVADCYNANPVSMAAALRHLGEVADGRRTVAVLGDMAELGREAERYHRETGDLARALGVEDVVGVGTLAQAYGGRWFPTLADALDALPGLVRDGDAVLVKGSRAMGLEAVVEHLTA
jgi:UDP-N-acetylmuramoyl-tripeptide--D-alanyl-D-alanine ligase